MRSPVSFLTVVLMVVVTLWRGTTAVVVVTALLAAVALLAAIALRRTTIALLAAIALRRAAVAALGTAIPTLSLTIPYEVRHESCVIATPSGYAPWSPP
jgi:hypothetical protein